MENLAPNIFRQRLVIEGLSDRSISQDEIKTYLSQLSDKIEMKKLIDPITHLCPQFGWAGWIHWETSGAHFYAWENPYFFSVDIYTCKAFDPAIAVKFTQEFFHTLKIAFQES